MLALFLLLVGGMAVRGQNRDAEVPGDNFSLEGALELFKQSQSPEEFEKLLNSKDSRVNNLDLNGDGYIDYIRVIDRTAGNVHTFTLQAVVSDTEVQDVAVIALEKKANGKAVLQIIGDEDVYGIETIIEPTQEVRVNAGTSTAQTVVNVWSWPAVQYVYSPSYVVWISPWSWTVRPVWWYHWRPIVYYDYVSYWRPYRVHYVHCYTPRIVHVHRIYRPHRVTSVIVHRRHETQLTRYRATHREEYNRSRSRNDQARYANTRRSESPRDVRATRPATRTRADGKIIRHQTEARNTKPVERKSLERTRTPVQRERNEVNPAERQRPAVEQSRSVERPAVQQRQEAKRERVSPSPARSSQPRVSSTPRSERAAKPSSGASPSRERSKRP